MYRFVVLIHLRTEFAVILNIPARGKAPFNGAITHDGVATAAANFVAGSLTLVPLR